MKKFSNGLRVLLVPSSKSLSVQVMVLVNTGSDFETKNTSGISHFIEHMCFKGTKKRPSSIAIARELDAVGSSYDAFTGHEFTGYWVRAAKADGELALDVVADIYLHSQFPSQAIKKERGVIIEEMNMYKDEPRNLIDDYWFHLLYGNQAAGWPIIGSKTNVKNFRRNIFLNYYKSQYRAQGTLLVVSGNFSEKKVLAQARKYFSGIRKGKGQKQVFHSPQQKTPQLYWKNKKTNQTHLLLGFRGINIFDKRKYTLALADTVLGGGTSVRLWQRIREELGAAYYLYSFADSLTNRGFWLVGAGVDNNRVPLIIDVILQEFQRFKKELIPEEELKKAKDYIRGKMSLDLEYIHNFATAIANQEILKKEIESPQQYFRKIEKVTASDIREVAQQILLPSALNLALIGPSSSKKRVRKLLLSFPK